MARVLRPFRILGQGVGYAVKGVRRGVGGAVRFAFPRRGRRKASSKRRGRRRGSRARAAVAPADSGQLDTWTAQINSRHFPQNLCAYERLGRKRCQELATVGCRYWGNWFDGRGLLRVKVYEFAVYMDPEQTRRSELSRVLRTRGMHGQMDSQFFKQLRSSSDIDMSLMLRASRSLPLKLVAGEYEKILKRRLVMVGGDSSDPALESLLSHLDDENIPDRLKSEKGHIKKGTILTFKKHKNGQLKTFAEGDELGSLRSPKLCAALFDLYIGDRPVCENAKVLAGKRVAKFIREQEKAPESRQPKWMVVGTDGQRDTPCTSSGLCLMPRQFDFGGFPQIDFGNLSRSAERV